MDSYNRLVWKHLFPEVFKKKKKYCLLYSLCWYSRQRPVLFESKILRNKYCRYNEGPRYLYDPYCILDAFSIDSKPRFKFLSPSTHRVIRHISRSVKSRNFSKYLIQRTIYLGASFYVGPYFLFFAPRLPFIFTTTVVNDCVYSNGESSIFQLDVFAHVLDSAIQIYIDLFYVDIEQRHNKQFFSNSPRYLYRAMADRNQKQLFAIRS